MKRFSSALSRAAGRGRDALRTAARAFARVRESTSAWARKSPMRYLFRELMAKPSASRWIGATTIFKGKFRSRTMRFTMAAC